MSRSLSFLVCLVIGGQLPAALLCGQTAGPTLVEAREGSAESLIVLRNGQILRGQVTNDRDRFLVRLPGREISVRRNDVDVVGRTLDEVYELKRAKVSPSDAAGRLDLAEWCLEQGLLGNVGTELAIVLGIQPDDRRLTLLDRRLRQALTANAGSQLAHKTETAKHSDGRSRASWPPVSGTVELATFQQAAKPTNAQKNEKAAAPTVESPAALERFVRTLPSAAVEHFTNSVQPMVVHGCATVGCHSPGNNTSFTLLRLPQGKLASRRLTQRNLYNTVQLVDFSDPGESRLLKIASQPHGPLKSGVLGDQRSPKYRQLVEWVAGVTSTKPDGREDSAEPTLAAVAEIPSENISGQEGRRNRRKSRDALSRSGNSPAGAGVLDHFPGSVQRASFEEAELRSIRPPAQNNPSALRQAATHPGGNTDVSRQPHTVGNARDGRRPDDKPAVDPDNRWPRFVDTPTSGAPRSAQDTSHRPRDPDRP